MTTSSKNDDHKYIELALNGDQNAFKALYDVYANGVYRLCYGLLMNRQDAEDVTQEAFIYAFKNLKKFNADRASFKTWLYTIAVSRSRNVHRRKRPITLDFTSMIGLPIQAPSSERPEAELSKHRAEEAVANAITSLTPRLREAVILRYGHGLTYREIANVLGCPQKTAESRVRLAHERLRGLLRSEGRGLLEEMLSY